MPNLVPKIQLWYIPEHRESFTSHSTKVKRIYKNPWYPKKNLTHGNGTSFETLPEKFVFQHTGTHVSVQSNGWTLYKRPIPHIFLNWSLLISTLQYTIGCTKTFCLCWVLHSKIAFMRCMTFSNILYVFGIFMNN